MLIWGSKGKAKKISEGIFFCPYCRKETTYSLINLGKYFTLYFIPIFETEKLSEYIECQRCKNHYSKEILNNNVDGSFVKLISSITDSLSNGIPVQLMVKQLTDNGIDEKTSKEIVLFSLGNSILECPDCGYFYSGKVSHCSMCGSLLKKPFRS